MSELAWLGSQLTAADLQAVTAADARGGLLAVLQLLDGAGLTDAGFAALEAQYQRGGLQAVGVAVQAQIQHEAQENAAQEAVTALEGLRPEQWQAVSQILATGGPNELAREAMALGLSPEAAAMAAHHVATTGVEQTRQAVAEQARERVQAEVAQQAAKLAADTFAVKEGDSAAVRALKEASPLLQMVRSPEFAAAAEGVARKLEAGGFQRSQGMSAAEFVLDALDRFNGGHVMAEDRKPFGPRIDPDKVMEAGAKMFGAKDGAAMRKAAEVFESARATHQLVDRLAKFDEKRPRLQESKPAPVNALRETIKSAAAKHGGAKPQPVGTGNLLQSQIAVAAGYDIDPTSHAAKEIKSYVESTRAPATDTSLRGTIEAAVATEEEREPQDNGGGNE
jgi:hypothetical protein